MDHEGVGFLVCSLADVSVEDLLAPIASPIVSRGEEFSSRQVESPALLPW